MTDNFWTNGSDEIIVDGSDQPIDCATCPCDIVPPCCNFATEPATATFSLTIDSLTPITGSMTKSGSVYVNDVSVICDLGDGHREIRLDLAIACVGSLWSVSFAYSVYTDGSRGNYSNWLYTFHPGDVSTVFSMSCSPFHAHFEGGNTDGVDGDGPTLACGGRTYPFNSAPGTINAILDIVTP